VDLESALLLDPTSEAAKDRAIVENGRRFEDDHEYKNSQLFKDIKRVAKWLNDPPFEEKLKNRTKELVEVRFCDLTPTIFTIKTGNFMFVEQYHMGKLEVLDKSTVKDKDVLCLGGYVPLFMLEKSSDFAKLMTSHFETIWDMMEGKTPQKVLEDIDDLETNPAEFRMRQFIEHASKRSKKLLRIAKETRLRPEG